MSRAAMLDAYLLSRAGAQFDWGAMNCCHFVARWVESLTGKNVMDGLPVMRSRTMAHRLIGQLGGSLQAAWTKKLESDPINPALAQVGDVVLVEHGDDVAVGICCGRCAAVLTPADGVAMVSMEHAACAWRVQA